MCDTINLVGYFQENIVYLAMVSYSVPVTQGHRYPMGFSVNPDRRLKMSFSWHNISFYAIGVAVVW